MRVFALLACLAPFVLAVPLTSTVDSTAVARDDCLAGLEICGFVLANHIGPSPTKRSAMEEDHLTNGERFKRSLGPNKVPKYLLSPTRVRKARTEGSAVPTVTKRGYIQVLDTDSNNAVLGYISKTFVNDAQSKYTTDQSDALIVNFVMGVTATTASQINLNQENGPGGFPYFGLVQGLYNTDSNIGPGNFDYGYPANTNGTPAGSGPATVGNSYTSSTGTSRTSESAVWSIDLATNKLAPQWINTDLSSPATYTFIQGTLLYFGGDPSQTSNRFGSSPVTNVDLRFVPI